jgi:hypothetical protein
MNSMTNIIGLISRRFALPAATLLLLSLLLRLLSGSYYQNSEVLLLVNIGIECSIILIFSYRSLKSLDEWDEESKPGYGSKFLLFNWTSILAAIVYISIAFLFFTVIDPGAWTPTKNFLLYHWNIEMRPGPFLVFLFLIYMPLSIMWSGFYLWLKHRFSTAKNSLK